MGNQQSYLEKDAQLDELLIREKFPQIEIEARGGARVKLSEARFGRFQRALHEFEGWSARLRSDFGNSTAEFMLAHRLIESGASSPKEAASIIKSASENGHLLDAKADAQALRVRVVEVETSAASDIVVPAELFASPIYEHVRRLYERLGEIVGGLPPFALRVGKQEEQAATFEALRDFAFTLAKHGIQITRFKGLAEMKADELWTTTMDPGRRMLVRVDVEDAATTDLWFSRLMGDEVEPRRLFIEQNALDASLDV
jgi:DNA gyrase subunit B